METITDSSPPASAKYAVPALEKGLDILECLSAQGVPMTQAQLARALKREPGELFRMLSCLEARNYVRRGEGGGYDLTLKLFELSRTHSPYDQLVQVAAPLMRELVDRIQQSCHLCVLHRDQVLVLVQEESPLPIRLSVQVGSLHSPIRTISGQVILAQIDLAERDRFLEAHSDFTRLNAGDRAAFVAQLDRIRADGWAHRENVSFVGNLDLSVPVGSTRSQTVAALTIGALKLTPEADLFEFLPRLRQCASDISRICGLP
jgi:DNA-binding IclR family transcriptional regulator